MRRAPLIQWGPTRPSTAWLLGAETKTSPGKTWPRARDGEQVDINVRQRDQLEQACERVGPTGTPGKVIAELTFGFWRFLSSSAHEKSVWVPYLHRLRPPRYPRCCWSDRSRSAWVHFIDLEFFGELMSKNAGRLRSRGETPEGVSRI